MSHVPSWNPQSLSRCASLSARRPVHAHPSAPPTGADADEAAAPALLLARLARGLARAWVGARRGGASAGAVRCGAISSCAQVVQASGRAGRGARCSWRAR